MLKKGHNLPRQHKGVFSRIFLFGLPLLALAVGAASAPFSNHALQVNAGTTTHDFSDEVVIDAGEISANVVTSAITDDSQTFMVTFDASTTIYNNGRYGNVFVKITDSAFNEEQASQTADANIAAAEEGTILEYEPETFESAVYKIAYSSGGGNKYTHDIVIPGFINFGKTTVTYPDERGEVSTYKYRLKVNEILPEVAFTNNYTREISWEKIESLTIPSSVEKISTDALIGAKEAGVKIYCAPTETDINNLWEAQKEAAEAKEPGSGALVPMPSELPEEFWEALAWNADWTDTDDITYNRTFLEDTWYFPVVEIDEEGEETIIHPGLNEFYTSPVNTNKQTLGEGNNYLLSCHSDDPDLSIYNFDFILEYKKIGNNEIFYYDLPLYSDKNYFDGIGSSIGYTDLKYAIDIPLQAGEEIDPTSLRFHNIHVAIREGNNYIPDMSAEAPVYTLIPNVVYNAPVRLNQFFTNIEVDSLATFFGYTDLKVKFDLAEDAFQNLKPTSYAAHKSEIEDGTLSVRTQFSSISQSYYLIKYKGANDALVEKEVRLVTPMDNVTITKGQAYGFLINNESVGPDFSADKIVSFTLVGFTLHLDLYNNVKHGITNNSKFDIRFATLNLISESKPASTLSIPLIFGLTFLGYTVLFALGAVGLYFYRKNRFKNDEFRRMNTKKFVIASVKNFAGFAIVLAAILCIVGRWGLFRNSVIVFNPLDPGVIAFTILGAIFLGFTIKNMVVAIKIMRERKKKERLRLDQDIVEDGTN